MTKKYPFLYGGLDEVGRGPLAGPVCAGAVVACLYREAGLVTYQHFLSRLKSLKLTDSKKLSPKQRKKILAQLGLRADHLEKTAQIFRDDSLEIVYALAELSPMYIDQVNIHQASLDAMRKALQLGLQTLSGPPKVFEAEFTIDGRFNIDGELARYCRPLVKADAKEPLVSLASVLAKESRDDLMFRYASLYPAYGFDKNAGYPTKKHRQALKKYGHCDIHRKSFKGVSEIEHQYS